MLYYQVLYNLSTTCFGHLTWTSSGLYLAHRGPVYLMGDKISFTMVAYMYLINTMGMTLLHVKNHSGRNEEQIKVKECLLSFGAESFVFQFAIQKFKD